MKNIIIGTAGHIDHGKTALVKALTGIDADRLEEEKRRGITIDIGFAHLQLTPELRLGFVDVPGGDEVEDNRDQPGVLDAFISGRRVIGGDPRPEELPQPEAAVGQVEEAKGIRNRFRLMAPEPCGQR